MYFFRLSFFRSIGVYVFSVSCLNILLHSREILGSDGAMSMVQSILTKGGHIIHGVVLSHETLHQSKNIYIIMLKVDFESMTRSIN